jgi:hypothetical protein
MSYSDIANLISAEGRAYLPSVKDLPPDEAQQHAIDAAKRGLIRFSDAIAIKGAADRVDKLAQSEAPPPGNVINDLKAQIRAALSGQQAPMQQMSQQGMPPQGMPPQGMPPQGAPPQPGLAGLPVSNIGTQAMAGGGIVAFSGPEGSLVGDAAEYRADPFFLRSMWENQNTEEENLQNELAAYAQRLQRGETFNPTEIEQIRSLESRLNPPPPSATPVAPVAPVAGATGEDTVAGSAAGDSLPASPTAAPVTPPNGGFNNLFGISPAYEKMIRDAAPGPEINEAEIRAQSDRELAAAGIGNAANAYAKKVAGYTSEDIKNINREGKQAQAAAYFDAAASGDTTFLGSISRGLGGAARAKSGTSKELRIAQREAEKAQYDLDAAREALSLQKTDRGTALIDKKRALRDQRLGVYQTLRSGQEQMNMSMQIALAKAGGRNVKTVQAVYAPQIAELEARLRQTSNLDEREKIAALMEETNGRFGQASAAAAALDAKNQEALKGKLNDAVDKELAQPDSLMATAKRQIAILTNKSTSEELDSDDVAKLQQYQNMYNNQYNAVAQRIYSIYGQSGGGGGNSDYTGYSIVPSE